MDDTFGVGCVERVGNLDGDGQQPISIDRPASDPVFQRHAF